MAGNALISPETLRKFCTDLLRSPELGQRHDDIKLRTLYAPPRARIQKDSMNVACSTST